MNNFIKKYRIMSRFDEKIPNYQNGRTRIFMYQKPSFKDIPSGFGVKT